MTSVRVAVARGARTPIQVVAATLGATRPGEAPIRIAGVGLCHTEVSAVADDRLLTFGTMILIASPPDAAAWLSSEIIPFVLAGPRVQGIVEGDAKQAVFIPSGLALAREGRFPFDRLIATCPLERIDDAIAAQRRGDCVTAVLIP